MYDGKRDMAKSHAKTRAVAAKTQVASCKLAPEQYALIKGRAEEQGIRVGVWMRSILLQAANAPRNGSFIKIREPNGSLL